MQETLLYENSELIARLVEHKNSTGTKSYYLQFKMQEEWRMADMTDDAAYIPLQDILNDGYSKYMVNGSKLRPIEKPIPTAVRLHLGL